MSSKIDGSAERDDMKGPRMARRRKAVCLSALGGLMVLAACAKQSGVGAPQPPPAVGGEVVKVPPAPPVDRPVTQGTHAARQESPLKDVFFDFDRANIRPDAKTALTEDVDWLRTHATAAITIEGHCDERGTSEYNVALGERRAQAAKDYLAAMGITGTRIRMVSYGKERPFMLGHDESAWKWNRRAHFVVEKE